MKILIILTFTIIFIFCNLIKFNLAQLNQCEELHLHYKVTGIPLNYEFSIWANIKLSKSDNSKYSTLSIANLTTVIIANNYNKSTTFNFLIKNQIFEGCQNSRCDKIIGNETVGFYAGEYLMFINLIDEGEFSLSNGNFFTPQNSCKNEANEYGNGTQCCVSFKPISEATKTKTKCKKFNARTQILNTDDNYSIYATAQITYILTLNNIYHLISTFSSTNAIVIANFDVNNGEGSDGTLFCPFLSDNTLGLNCSISPLKESAKLLHQRIFRDQRGLSPNIPIARILLRNGQQLLEEEYIIYVSLIKSHHLHETKIFINLQFISLQCKHIREEYTEEFLDDFGGFFDKILNYDYGIKNIYGVVFALYDLEDGFHKNISQKLLPFRQHCERYCIKHKLAYIFINKSLLNISATLFATNLLLNDGDLVTVVHLMDEKSVEFDSKNKIIFDKTTNWVTVIDLEWKKDAFKLINWQKFDEKNKSPEEIKALILRNKSFKKIIITSDSPNSRLKTFRGIIKSKKRIIIENGFKANLPEIISIIVKEFRGEIINKFKILPCSLNVLIIQKGRTAEKWLHKICEFSKQMPLPYEECLEVNKYDSDYIDLDVMQANGFNYCGESWKWNIFNKDDIKYHTAKITIKMEVDGFFTCVFEPIFGPYLRRIPSTFSSTTVVKIYLHNFSAFVWIKDISMLKDSDDEIFFPMAIGFFDELIVVGKKAEIQKIQHPNFVVSNLLFLIEMVAYGNEEYPYQSTIFHDGTIVKRDQNGTHFVIFETFRGKRKAKPRFLIAGFIKSLLNLATKNIGFEPENIQIWIDHDSAKMEELKKEVSASMNLLNVKYGFVENFKEN